jgi:hypothetical protein
MSTSYEGNKKQVGGGAKCSRNLVLGTFKVAEAYLEKEWLTTLQKSYNRPSNPLVDFVTVFNSQSSFGKSGW